MRRSAHASAQSFRSKNDAPRCHAARCALFCLPHGNAASDDEGWPVTTKAAVAQPPHGDARMRTCASRERAQPLDDGLHVVGARRGRGDVPELAAALARLEERRDLRSKQNTTRLAERAPAIRTACGAAWALLAS
jgi:hypothetical protein